MPDTAPRLLPPLIDRFDRVHRDLRISVTDRCSLRCTYCMPEQGVPWLAKTTMLSTEELLRLADVAVSLGITEVRLTGGEPLLRRDLVDVVAGVAALEGAEGPVEVSMTTNALGLDKAAVALREAGLTRVNISLDTLQTETLQADGPAGSARRHVAGIHAAADAGLTPVKLNTVLLRGVNDHEAVGPAGLRPRARLRVALHRADAAGRPAHLAPRVDDHAAKRSTPRLRDGIRLDPGAASGAVPRPSGSTSTAARPRSASSPR